MRPAIPPPDQKAGLARWFWPCGFQRVSAQLFQMLVPFSLMAVCATTPALAADLPRPLPVKEVASGVFVHQAVMEEMTVENAGDTGNCGFVVGGAAVAVIDACGSADTARRLLATVSQTTGLPVRYLILTHMHPDHVFGMGAIIDSPTDQPVEVIAHSNLPDGLAARTAFYKKRAADVLGEQVAAGITLSRPTRLVSDRLVIDLGDRPLELVAWPAAHTDNDLTVLDQRTATLWTGDLLFVDRAPALDGSLRGWLAALDQLMALPATRAVPGHGPADTPWPEGGIALKRYLGAIADGVRLVQQRRGSINEAVAVVGVEERQNWHLFDDYHARNVTAAFAELEWE